MRSNEKHNQRSKYEATFVKRNHSKSVMQENTENLMDEIIGEASSEVQEYLID